MRAAPAGRLRADRLVHRTGHPSFTADVARSLVAGLSVPRLLEVWRLTDPALDPASPRARANLVVLRGVLLDALAETDPDFASWIRVQSSPPGS